MKNRIGVLIGFMVLMLALGTNDALRGVFSTIFSQHFSLSTVRLAQIVTVSYVGNLVFLLVGGKIIDRFERKKTMLFFIVLWMCALTLFVVTDSYICILIGMFLAMGTSTLLNTTINLVTPLLFTASPGFAVGFLFFTQGIGTSGSQSIIGNWATEFSSWKTVNIGLLCLGAIAFVLLLFCQIPDNKSETAHASGEQAGTAAIVKNPMFLPLVFIFGFYFVAEHGIMNWLVNYASTDLGVEMGTAANYTAVFFGGITLGRLLLSPLVDKLGVFRCLVLFGSGAAVLYAAGVLLRENGLWLLSASGVLFSVLYPTLVMIIPKLWPSNVVSSASGMVISLASLADIGFNALFGPLVDKIGYASGFLLMPLCMLGFAVMLWVFMGKRAFRK